MINPRPRGWPVSAVNPTTLLLPPAPSAAATVTSWSRSCEG